MGRTMVAVFAMLVLAAGAAEAQFQPLPAAPYQAIAPGATLNPHGDSPVQQQLLQNYRTQLQQTQRDLLQQNPSGLGRDQIEIGRQLNTYNPAYFAAPGIVPPAANLNLAPFSASGTLSPPYNAAHPTR